MLPGMGGCAVRHKCASWGPHEDGHYVGAIKALIARQVASLRWAPGKPADWTTFTGGVCPDASLYPAARPVKSQTVEAFVERIRVSQAMMASS
jgi:hypothetical protein